MPAKERPEKNTDRRRAPSPPRRSAPVQQHTAGAASVQSVAALQRTAGNAAVARMIEEQRARDDASAALSAPEEHRHGAGCGHDGAVQRSAADEVGSVVSSGGSRLAPSLRQEMEARFDGEDFSDVEVHTGSAAQRSAEAVGAEAYTTDTNHIVFRSAIEKRKLAHELEHVRQQRAGEVAGTDNGSGLRVSNPSDDFERSAESKAVQVMQGEVTAAGPAAEPVTAPGPSTTGPAGAVQRLPKKYDIARKKNKGKDPAPKPAEKSEWEKIVEYFEGHSPEFQEKLPNEKVDILEQIGIAQERDPELSEWNDADTLKEFLEAVNNTKHASGYDEEGAGRSDWAAGSVGKAHEQLRGQYDKWGSATTLHHKISRSRLAAILSAAEKAGKEARPLFDFLDEVRAAIDSGAKTGNKKAFENMPANLEMGPSSDTRRGDPGAAGDFNYDRDSGAMTPRSNALAEAERLAGSADVKWGQVAAKLREAQQEHEELYGGAILSPPDYERWKQVGNKWQKQ